MTDDKILRKIAAALTLAENAATEDEADTAMRAAQRLATSYSIDLATARSHQAKQQRRTAPTHRTITLGEAGKRGLRTYVRLFLSIASANDVEVNIAHNSTYVVVFGFDEDIALAEALYSSLVVQMVQSSDAYLKAGTFRHELVYRRVTRTNRFGRQFRDWDLAPVTPATARINFQLAFGERVGERLREAAEKAKADAIAADREAGGPAEAATGRDAPKTGTELAIVEKAVEVRDYYQATSTARGTWRGGRAQTTESQDARAAGDRAGRRARLGGEKGIGRSRRPIAS